MRVEICGQNRKTGQEASTRTARSEYLCFDAAVRRNGLAVKDYKRTDKINVLGKACPSSGLTSIPLCRTLCFLFLFFFFFSSSSSFSS